MSPPSVSTLLDALDAYQLRFSSGALPVEIAWSIARDAAQAPAIGLVLDRLVRDGLVTTAHGLYAITPAGRLAAQMPIPPNLDDPIVF